MNSAAVDQVGRPLHISKSLKGILKLHVLRTMFWEKWWCGESLLTSIDCLPFCKSPKEIAPLRRWHFLSMLSGFMQIAALFILLMGAFLENMPLFVIGAFLKMTSFLFGGWIHNASAAFLSLWSTQFLNETAHYKKELSGILHEKGLTEAEIAALPNLPHELYQTELHNVQSVLLLNILTPLVSMGVLLLFGEWVVSLSIFLLGCAVFPLGRFFYRRFYFGQNRLLRLAQTARAYTTMKHSYAEHILLTTQVNAIGQLPFFLFTLFMLMGVSHTPFAHYLAFTFGLTSLSGLLAFQKTRLHSEQTIKRARHLLNTLSKSPFLFTSEALKEHASACAIKDKPPSTAGIFINQLRPKGIPHVVENPPITCFIPEGGVCLIKAPSGYGKSIFLLSLLHLIDHTGDVWFCGKQLINFHTLPTETWNKQFAFFREEDLPTSTRIIDLFAQATCKQFEPLYQELRTFSEDLARLVFFGSDVLLEQELTQEDQALFPSNLIKKIEEFRQLRVKWLSSLLQQAHFPLNVHPLRVFGTLSRGESRRMVNFLTLHLATTSKVRLIILDEPLSHLDQEATLQQITLLKQTQQQHQIPMLIITHHHTELLTQSLEHVQVLSLNAHEELHHIALKIGPKEAATAESLL